MRLKSSLSTRRNWQPSSRVIIVAALNDTNKHWQPPNKRNNFIGFTGLNQLQLGFRCNCKRGCAPSKLVSEAEYLQRRRWRMKRDCFSFRLATSKTRKTSEKFRSPNWKRKWKENGKMRIEYPSLRGGEDLLCRIRCWRHHNWILVALKIFNYHASPNISIAVSFHVTIFIVDNALSWFRKPPIKTRASENGWAIPNYNIIISH